MRLHITLDEQLVRRLDERVAVGRRSAFIAAAVGSALEHESRWDLIEGAIGSIEHDADRVWGEDASGWVRAERRGDGDPKDFPMAEITVEHCPVGR